MRRAILLALAWTASVSANPPVASYLFPAGGQRGTAVDLKVAGLFLHQRCGFALAGPGIVVTPEVRSVPTLWFEGPMLPLPDSQRQEDYPRDMAGRVTLAADAPLGQRRGQVWTAEGVATGLTFVVGDLPEIVEREIEGDPLPVRVTIPLTINGRVFPRQDADLWTVELKKGTTITASASSRGFGSPLDARLELVDASGQVLAEKTADGRDPMLRFTAPGDGVYGIRISDSQLGGSPSHVYRLTITDGPWIDSVFPLGGRKGETVKLHLTGQGVPAEPMPFKIPETDGPVALTVAGKSTNLIAMDSDTLAEALPSEETFAPPVVFNGRIDRPGQKQTWKVQLSKGKPQTFEVRGRAFGSRLQPTLVLRDAADKQVAQGEATLNFSPAVDGVYVLEVSDRFAGRGGPNFGYRVRVSAGEPDFRFKLLADSLNLTRGATVKVRVPVERLGGFADPIALTIEGLPAGVTAAPVTIARGAAQAEVTLTATAEVTIGAANLTITGTAGTLVRSTPLVLGVALAVPFKVVADYEMRWSARGSTHRRAYRIERNGYTGPLEIRLADRQARHLQGVTGPVLTVPADRNEFEYPVLLAPGMEIGRTCRVCIMVVGVVREGGKDHEVSYGRVEQNDQIVTVVETGRLGIELTRPAIEAKAGRVEVPFAITRGKELKSPVRIVMVVPENVRGVKAEPLELTADRLTGKLVLNFAEESGPFPVVLMVRVIHEDASGTTLAEAPLEIVPEQRK